MSYAEELHKAHKERLERIASRAFVKAREIRAEARSNPTKTADEVEFAYEVAYQFMELGAEVAREIDGDPPPVDLDNLRVEGGFALSRIQRVVANHYGVTVNDLLSAGREARIVRPRQVAIYLAKVTTLRSLPEIGRRFGGRDHTTILHAYRKIRDLMVEDIELAATILAIKKRLAELKNEHS